MYPDVKQDLTEAKNGCVKSGPQDPTYDKERGKSYDLDLKFIYTIENNTLGSERLYINKNKHCDLLG